MCARAQLAELAAAGHTVTLSMSSFVASIDPIISAVESTRAQQRDEKLARTAKDAKAKSDCATVVAVQVRTEC